MRGALLAFFILLSACPGSLQNPERFTPPDSGPVTCTNAYADLIGPTCATSGCHTAQAMSGGLDLSSPEVADSLVGKPVLGAAGGLKLIDAESPEDSVLYTKLFDPPVFGLRMPLTGELNEAQRACVLDWVRAAIAAHDGGTVVDAGSGDAGRDAGFDGGGGGDGGFDAGQDAGPFYGPAQDGGCSPSGWCVVLTPPQALYGVRGLSANDVWAVGAGGTVLRYDGTTWNSVASGQTGSFFDVFPVAAGEAWAVGEGGLVVHFTPGGAQRIDAGTDQDLGGVWALSPNDVHVVGVGDTLLRWNGTRFNRAPTDRPDGGPFGHDFIRLYARPNGELWAVGDFVIARFENNVWKQSNGALTGYFSIWGSNNGAAQDVLVAVGVDGAMHRFNYANPTETYPWQPPGYNSSNYGLESTALRSIWLGADGGGYTVGLNGALLNTDVVRRRYTREVTPVSDHYLGVWSATGSEVWAVGGRIQGVIVRKRP